LTLCDETQHWALRSSRASLGMARPDRALPPSRDGLSPPGQEPRARRLV